MWFITFFCVFFVFFLCFFFCIWDFFGSFFFNFSFFFSWSILKENFVFFFFVCLLFIFLSIFFYCYYYMNTKVDINFYMILMIMFCISMSFLILHSSGLMLLLGWDGLGLTSYVLVYYFFNWSSINSSFVTVLTNRMGDCFILIFLLKFFFLKSFFFGIYFCFSFVLFLFFAGITKSAQFPFSSWLPQAMAAPTPTSALVHSSTLVTAGLFLFLKYSSIFFFKKMLFFFLLMGIFTVFISGLMSLLEKDGKKIIALSTLNQLGLMVFSLSLGGKILVFFHMITHAFFKSCMFLQMGTFIHSLKNNQDMRGSMMLLKKSISSSLIFSISIFSLMGIVFLSGYSSKELIFFSIFFSNFLFFFFFFLLFCFIFTLFYSIRLINFLFFKKLFFVFFYENSKNFFFSSFFLFILGFSMGWLVFQNFCFFVFFVVGKESVVLLFLFLIFLFYFTLNKKSNMGFQNNFYKLYNFIFSKYLWENNNLILKGLSFFSFGFFNFFMMKKKITMFVIFICFFFSFFFM